MSRIMLLLLSISLLLFLVPPLEALNPGNTTFSSLLWSMRLPDSVKPLHYDLLIHPNLTSLSFSGAVQIQLDVLQETRHIFLHSKSLEISRALLLGSRYQHLLQVQESEAFEQIALSYENFTFSTGLYVIRLEFSANLSESFHGFYKGTYRTSSGEVRTLASTQFEATHARSAFPCFDEPAFKANFSIRVRREPRHISISNMPKLKTVELAGGLLEDQYDVTVKMSTYLVAFIVCDFLSISRRSQHGVEISVYTVPEKISQAEYALNTAVTLLDFYDDYFNIPYPLPKQDLAAIPDFQSGAMENWGLTTYRESGLLFDPERSSTSDKLGITKVIAHELAHQWFGNLVTMQWWNDLWLNEGFAKFMEFVSVNLTYPELQVDDYFLEKCFTAMGVDSLSSSHPISTPVENPAQIREMFDDVSYQKGACVLNMLRDFLTPEVFKIGIIRYLKKHSYQNTVNSDLWYSLTNVCQSDDLDLGRLKEDGFCSDSKTRTSASKWFMEDDLDVREIMDTWTLQEGFPLITVEVKGREVRLKQERFLKGAESANHPNFLWKVPLTYITSGSSSVQRFLLKTRHDVLYLPAEVEWVKFNVDMRGYYIVHYAAGGWDALIRQLQLNHTVFSGNDRASLIHNIFQLVSIGKVPLDRALSLSQYLSSESEIMPVTQGFSELVPLYKLMEKRDMAALENQLKGYLVNVFRRLIDAQSWSDDGSVSERMLRNYLLLFACVRRLPACVGPAQRLFRQWKESDGALRLAADVRLVVYTEGARTEEGWDFLLEKHGSTMYPSERSQIKAALSYSPLPHKLEWLMEKGLEGEILKTHELPSLIISVSKNPTAYRLAWDFLTANWQKLVKKFDLGSSAISRMVVGVTNQYSTQEKLEEVQSFFGSLDESTGAGLRSIQQALQNIQENIRWMDQNVPVLQDWLNRHSTGPAL
ncbi:endoplasmic reticulum aminopeptidase 1 [Astyanax mexicanus]|uniref:Aminopeptidase n=1 Tax=Astyanax mexicanus TaxID=7994 RepID=A0A8T2L0Y6_ASTMX|nr:endoplasmic reticulum aminopeptidase 1 [Astyanax mexicanus]XP_049324453.1 endoplasmic reticulum aminopeptidase 1 [Astyanax mexicanus]KAG9262956.1 endoplasmic reticulum aminopeptidase 1-like [Astyanax mexicanus]